MTDDELKDFWLNSESAGGIPTKMADGAFALLVFHSRHDGFGFQVPTEEAIRWRRAGVITRDGDALMEVPAPTAQPLTAAQLQVLRFCARFPGWLSLTEIERHRLLEDDDVLTVPSLIERHLLRYNPALTAVLITPAGEVLADE
jgi:hypothetical protein